MYTPRRMFLVCLVAYCIVVKALPFLLANFGLDTRIIGLYPWSWTPIFAFALFGVGTFRDVRLACAMPVLAWLAADVLIGVSSIVRYGWSEGLSYALYPGQFLSYVGLMLVCGCGLLIRRSRNWGTILAASLLGPTVYFLVSNFAVWAFDLGIGYPRTPAGLLEAYVAGLPFYRNQLLSTLGFSALLFSPLGMAQLERSDEAQAAQPAAAVEV